MAYDEVLAGKVREILEEQVQPVERKMFGGLAFMVDGNMCCGVLKEDLIIRLGKEVAEKALRHPAVRPMDFTGRPMKNFLFVSAKGTATEPSLRKWIGQALEFVNTLPPKKPSSIA